MPRFNPLTLESNNPGDFPTFKHLDQLTIERKLKKAEGLLGNLSSVLKMETSKITMSKPVMAEIIERVEKRRIYFHIFHKRCKMGELNEASLICFWMLKLHPFSCPHIDANELNAKIALCFLTNTVYCHVRTSGKKAAISQQLLKETCYAFKFRDLSKEAIMLLATSLGAV